MRAGLRPQPQAAEPGRAEVSPSRRSPSAHTPTPRYRAATATTASATGTSGSLSDQATPAAPGRGEQGAGEQQAGLPAQAEQVTGDDGERARPCERSRSPRPRCTGVAASSRAARRSPASTAPPSRVERMLWARRAGRPEAAERGGRAERPEPAAAAAPVRRQSGRRPDPPAPTWPASQAAATATPSAGPARSATTRDVGPVVPDAHRPPPSTPATTVVPATSSVAETSHHSRRVVARSRGPATTWSTHGSGGTTGPRAPPEAVDEHRERHGQHDGHHRGAGAEQAVVEPPRVARDEQGARHGEAVGEREQREEVHGVQHALHRAGAVRAVEHVGDVLEARLVLGALLGGGHAGPPTSTTSSATRGRERRVVAGHQHRRAGRRSGRAPAHRPWPVGRCRAAARARRGSAGGPAGTR